MQEHEGLEWHRLAQRDLEEAHRYYRRRSKIAADRFLLAVEEAIEFIQRFPEGAEISSKRTRNLIIEKYPYSLVYNLDRWGVLIVAVAHQKRRQGYWKRRL